MRLGYCYTGEGVDSELVRIKALSPGDVFRFIPDDYPAVDVIADPGAPMEQRANLLLAALSRVPVLRFISIDDDGVSCTATVIKTGCF